MGEVSPDSHVSPIADEAINGIARGVREMDEMEDRWLSMSEICRFLGVSKDTVYKWINKHEMPSHRMGRLWKFKKDEVDAWVKAGGASGHNNGILNKNE